MYPNQMDALAAKYGGVPVGQKAPTSAPDNRDFLQKASDFVTNNNLPGSQIGQMLGNSVYGLSRAAQGDWQGFNEAADANSFGKMGPKVIGDTAQVLALPASLGLAAPASLPAAMAQYGGLGAATSGGASLAAGNSPQTALRDAATGGAVSGVAGGVFNLLGRGISSAASRFGPTALEFTSGVPKAAISKAVENPTAAKEGLATTVRQARDKMLPALQGLYRNLSDEFGQGLDSIKSTTGQTKAGMTYNQTGFLKSAQSIQNNLTNYARDFAREFRISTKMTPEGVALNFDKSPIVKGGEAGNVQKAFTTLSTWSDYSAKGMQDLAERIGALRNFESGARTESSAIIGKIYNKIASKLIPQYYPELAALRTNFGKNKTVLDEIQNVLGADKTKPVSVQSSVSRLDNLFKDNRDEYLNAIKALGDRTGTDYLGLLAGGEFQKLLPGFIRGFGGGATVAVGSHFVSPLAILLSPLFSPRGVGLLSRNASAIGNATSQLTRAATTQATRLFQSTPGSQK